MKLTFAIFSILLAVASSFPLQTSKPIPPGIREADKLPGPADVPPLDQPSRSHTDAKLMREQAEELSTLAQAIPADVSHVAGGTLPKDMNEKLKRIEKLSKTLRREISQ